MIKKMIKVNDERDQINIAKVYEAGQEQIFRWWEELSPESRKHLLDQVAQIDFQLLNQLAKKHIISPVQTSKIKVLSPPPIIQTSLSSEEEQDRRITAREWGEEALRSRKVAIFMSAGEAATKLEATDIVGLAEVGPVSYHTLYEWHAEKIVALCDRYKSSIPWIIMVSDKTEKPTIDYFEQNSYFGLSSADVRFVKQKMIPILDKRGKITLKEKDTLNFSTNGYGGALAALDENEVIEELSDRGIEYLFYFQVNNPLVKIADPIFLGYHLLEKAEVSTKAIAKRSVEEEMDVVSYIDGNLGVLDHNELPEEEKNARTGDGSLTYYAGNAGIHFFSLSFIQELLEEGLQLPYHKQEKSTSFINRRGEKVAPDQTNSIKFETFVFDLLQRAENKIFVEVPRWEEYAPIREMEGPFSLVESRKVISSFYSSWFETLGDDFLGDPENEISIEVSPRYALDLETFREKLEGKI